MTTYTAISNTLVQVGAYPFATTIQALRDNPLAIAEGDATSPKVQTLAMVNFAARSGMVANLEVDFTYAVQRLRIVSYVSPQTSTATTFRMRCSDDGGATWSGYSTLLSFGSSAAVKNGVAETEVDMLTGVYSCYYSGDDTAQRGSGTMTVPADCDAIQLGITSGTASHTVYYVGVA